MRNLKRVLSLALALVMVLGMMVITTSAADFTDADEIKYEESVKVMSEIGIIKGMGDGTFAPKGELTRAQAAKILAYVMLGDEAENYLTGSAVAFTDVKDHWAAKYITFCKNAKVIDGMGDGTFNPEGKLTVVAFAKLLLAAIEAEGTFTGDGWEENVKNAFNKVPELKATGIKVSTNNITREEACELALAAMMAGETYSNGYYIEGYEAEFGYCDSYADAYIMAKAMELTNFTVKLHKDTRDSLLEDVYGVKYIAEDVDAWGRPGVGYEKTVGGKKVVDLFFVNEGIVFEGYQNGTDGVYAINAELEAAGVVLAYDEESQYPQNGYFVAEDGKTTYKPTVTVITDGKVGSATLTTTYDIAKLTNSKDDVVMEVYVADGEITDIVVIETHAAIALNQVKANAAKEIKASVELDGIVYETEELEEGDVVLFTKVWNAKKNAYAVASIVKEVEPFVGVLTAYTNKNVFTVNGENYYVSYGAIGDVKSAIKGFEMAEEYYYWLGACGEIIYAAETNLKEEEKEETKTVYTYAVVLDAEGRDYVAAEDASLLAGGKDAVEAAEVLKVKLADDSVVVLETAWEYVVDKKTGKIVDVEFVNGGAEPTVTSGLIKYAVDKDGKVTEIIPATTEAAAGTVNKATASTVADVLTDSTVIYMEANGRYEVAIGYKAVAAATYTSAVVFADKGVVEAVVLNGYEAIEAPKVGTDHLVYVAGFDYVTEWDASANNGKGAVVYVYTNVYVDGEKSTLTFAEKPYLNKGLFEYNTVSGLANTNLLADLGDVALIQSGFFKADEIVYVNADTVYVEITSKGLEVVDGLYAVKDYTNTIQYVEYNKAGVATLIYFSAVEVEG